MKVGVATRVGVVSVGLALAVGSLAGCAAQPTPEPTTSASETTEPTTEPTPTEPAQSFTMPADCTSILPSSIVKELAKDSITLLAGPGGKYGNELITEPTPEMSAGGISCYFGVDSEDPSLLEIHWLISAVALDETTRATVLADLQSQGLNQSTDDAGDDTFGSVGNSNGQKPATYNVVAADSWISVISAGGGTDIFAQAVILATDVHAANYN